MHHGHNYIDMHLAGGPFSSPGRGSTRLNTAAWFKSWLGPFCCMSSPTPIVPPSCLILTVQSHKNEKNAPLCILSAPSVKNTMKILWIFNILLTFIPVLDCWAFNHANAPVKSERVGFLLFRNDTFHTYESAGVINVVIRGWTRGSMQTLCSTSIRTLHCRGTDNTWFLHADCQTE